MRIKTTFFVLVSAAAVLLSLTGAFAGQASRAGMQEILSAQLPQTERDLKLLGWFEQQYAQGLPVSEADKEMYLQLESRYADLRGPDNLDNQGGPDAFQYMFVDNVAPDTVTYQWIELRGDPSATLVNLWATTHDDGYSYVGATYPGARHPIGFSFPFYGVMHDSFRVCTNGFIQFTTTSTALTNGALPNTGVGGAAIFAYWDDLHLDRNGQTTNQVMYRNFGNYLVIEFDSIGVWNSSCGTGGTTNTLKFEVILFSNGNIKIQYNRVNVCNAQDSSMTVGIQSNGTAGSAALQYCYGTGTTLVGPLPATGRAIRFSRASGVPSAVTNLTGNYVAPNVVLTWTDPTQDTQGNPITIDNIQVWAGAVETGTLLATVPPGVQTYTEMNAPTGSRTYYVRAFRSPYYGAAVSRTVVVGSPSYSNNFDTNNGGWVPNPLTGGWEWGAPTLAAGPQPHSAPNCWGTVIGGEYINGACWKVDLNLGMPVVSPSAAVEFWAWYLTENTFDGCNFKVSTDNGMSWTVVAPTGGYPLASLDATWNICGTGGQPAWAGTGSSWRQVVIPIGQFLGNTPIFRFDFTSDTYSATNPGFYFDDMVIWGLQAPAGIPRAVTNLAGNYVSPNVNLTWTDPTLDLVGNPVTLTNLQVWLGAAVSGQLLGTVNPGVQAYTHVNAPSGHATYTVRAYASPNYGPGASVTVTVGAPSYDEGFESSGGGWVSSQPGGVWQWGAPTVPTGGPVPHGGTHCWGTTLTGIYPFSACEFLDLTLGLPVTSAAATVEFWYWVDCEGTTAYDGANFKVSTDGGSSWTLVTPQAGYNASAFDPDNVCTPGEAGWSRRDSTWRYAVLPIWQFVGQTPVFRFTFGSDPLYSYRGFFFDDMQIWGLQAPSSVAGVVRAFEPTMPIRSARVWAAGESDTAVTDALGAYELALDPGTYTLWYRHMHFCDTVHTGVVVETGSQTVHDAVMRAPHGEVSVTSLTLETPQGVNVVDSFQITNSGGQCPLSFTISDASDWLSVDAVSGTVLPNQTATIHVQATVGGMAEGGYDGSLRVTHNSSSSPANIRVDLHIGPNAVDPGLPLPTEFAYYPNYPNPFNAQTSLRFDVPQQSRVQIAVFNIMGQEVARPVDNAYAPGRYRVLFDAAALPSGMYVVRMSAADYTKIGKMMLLK